MDFDLQAKEAAIYNYAMLLHQRSPSAFGEAITTMENFLNTYPKSIYSDRINDALIYVYTAAGDYEKTLASIAKINSPGAKIWEAAQKVYYYLGTVYFTDKNYSKAIQYFTQAISAGDHAVSEKNASLYWRAESYYQTGNYAQAVNGYQAYLNAANTDENLSALAVYGLAYCAFNRQQYTAAEDNYRNYIRKNKDKPEAVLADVYARLGDCCFRSRRLKEAANAYGPGGLSYACNRRLRPVPERICLGTAKRLYRKNHANGQTGRRLSRIAFRSGRTV
jgi:tetratricopeptide (TPR) repeat protein